MKRGKGIKLKINLTNRWKYSLIVGTFIVVVLSLAFLGQSIFAAAGSECVVNGGKCILYSYSCGDLSGGYVDAALDCGSRSEKCCKPTVRHNSSQILINVDGVETNLQTAWDQRETNLVCTTGVLNSNTPPYNVKAYMPSNTPLVGGYYESMNCHLLKYQLLE